ncbi:MAG: SDR family NAD(P)-dependent oxidoreductase [Rhodocyclales bacterium]|nr:SDR family NAD(P)-dependent oxidoreductase [Rhodocyclales bacterium]
MQEVRADVKDGATADRRSLLQNALAAIERLQDKLDAVERARHEPIAVVGMACRVPGGAEDPDAFWQLLAEGRDVVGEVPPDRWDVDAYYDPDPGKLGKTHIKAGGFLSNIDHFEPSFFGMSPREAAGVDPQQRLLLEASWHALEDACIAAGQLDASLTGVFFGITSMDYSQRIDVADPARSDIYLATGTALNAAAGRVSFTFGLRGPSMAIDTACSSSLVAIHTACQSLRDGECNLALTGGVNAILSPDPFVLFSKWGMLSRDGKCKTFDASANGFVRGEGCGVIVLERLSDAIANGRRILAVIPGSAINQDGRSSGLTVPNGLAQQEVVRHALSAARLKPTDVSYVEAHGTATSLGDPIEVEALAAAYGEGRGLDQPFEVGSVKSNIGHLEAASGVVSIIKLVKALQHRQIPASLHVKSLSPAIPWDTIPVRVSTQLHDWQPQGGRRIAGASAFGFTGMNAHVLVEEAPHRQSAAAGVTDRPLFALPLSAKSDAALAALATLYADHLERIQTQSLRDICATAAIGRSHLSLRTLLVAPDRDTMVALLRATADGTGTAVRGTVAASGRHRVAFLFTGQGAQYVGMGRELYQTEPVFREVLDRCAAVLDPLLGRPLREVMFEETAGSLDQTGFTQPALYAIEVALAALWRNWGIEPSVVIGHSVGEFAAAAVAGVFSVEAGARLIAARGRLMQALPAGGSMVSVEGDTASVQREVAACSAQVSIAAFNAPGNVVISGASSEVEAIAARLGGQGLRTQALQVSHAFHSPLMAPMLDEFHRIAAQVVHSAPALTWISNLTGAPLDWADWGTHMADYWTRHVREPVAFERGMATLGGCACDVHLEIGPNPTLIGLGKQCLPDTTAIEWLPSLKRVRPPWEQMLDSIARLYVRGARLDWQAFHGRAADHSLELPIYPFQRQKFLIPFAPKGSRRVADTVHELLGQRLSVAGVAAQFEQLIDKATPAWLGDHRIASEVVMPSTAYLEAALAAGRQVHGNSVATLEGVEVGEALALRDGEQRVLQVAVEKAAPGSHARVRMFSRDAVRDDAEWILNATATLVPHDAASTPTEPPLAEIAPTLVTPVEVGPFYDKLRGLGVDFGPGFRCMKRVWCAAGAALGEIEPSAGVLADAGKYLMHPALLDACFHVAAVAIDSLPGADEGRMYLPIGVDRYQWFASPTTTLRSYATVRPAAMRADMLVVDIRIEALDGAPVARLQGLRCRRASRDMFRQRVEAQVAGWLYELAWQPHALVSRPAGGRREGTWLIFDEGAGRGRRLADEIVQRGGKAIRVLARAPGTTQEDALVCDPTLSADYARVLATVGRLAGVVSLWPLCVPALGADDVPGGGQGMGTDAALVLLQALAVAAPSGSPPRIWIVTAGSQIVDGTETLRIEQAPVAGMVRVAATEHPEMRVSLIDLDPQGRSDDARWLADEVIADDEEAQVAVRKGVRWIARLARKPRHVAPHVDDAPIRLNIRERGTLENLFIEPAERRAPGPGQVELRVRASGLNFRDVLSVLGMYPGELRLLGSDCAGEVTAVGEGVTQFAVGDRVVAMAEGAFASHATTRWEFVAPLPGGLDFEQGAAIPTAYLTAEITLNLIGRMKSGDRVLIHSGAGGVGMAGIALARRAGAEIFATAGSPEKRAVLTKLGVHHVLDSRSTSFGDEVMRITHGKGVDIVLNSLAGALLDKSFECLAEGGTFLEIGKRGVWSHERVAALNRGIRYHIVDCNDNARDTPTVVGEIFARVLRDIEAGVLPWLPCTTFPFETAADAFRFMAQAKHIGRVVFRHRVVPRPLDPVVRSDATYVVTGGLKGLGLLAAQWLAAEGARTLLLVGRSKPDATAQAAIESMTANGTRVVCAAADIGTSAGVDQVFAGLGDGLPALAGLVHCAGVLDDGVIARQSPERFAKVMAPKADGAWRLHCALEKHGHRPDFFVLYSSLSAILGSAGQSNYAAANAFLDALAHRRRAADQAATSINWGAWSDVGMAARGSVMSRAAAQGVGALSPVEGIRALSMALRDNVTQVSVAPIDWAVLGKQFGALRVPPVLRDLVSEADVRSAGERGTPQASSGSVDFSRLGPQDRYAQIVKLVRRELVNVLALGGAADAIAPDQRFSDLGLDSLTSVELRNRIQSALGRSVPPTAAFDWPTVVELARNLDAMFAVAPVTDGQSAAVVEESGRENITL